MSEKVTKRLAEFIHATGYEDIPASSLEMAKNCILDWCGVAIQGQKEQASRLIIEFINYLGGKPMASVIGTNIRTNITNAALANGTIGHSLDFDDYHDETVIHATAACLPRRFSGRGSDKRQRQGRVECVGPGHRREHQSGVGPGLLSL